MTQDDSSEAPSQEGGRFPLTLWSVIAHAGSLSAPDNHEALSRFCEAYWYPLYAFVRRRGCSPHDAQDLIQGFFAHLVQNNGLAAVAPGRGKFRSFLLTCLKHFIENRRGHDQAQKRGGGVLHLPLDFGTAETRYGAEPADPNDPEKLCDRAWALLLLERTMARLQAEQTAAGHARLFELLSPRLTDSPDAPEYEAVAAELGMQITAVRMAKRRLIERYRELLRAEIARTVGSPAEVDDEIRHLFAVLAG